MRKTAFIKRCISDTLEGLRDGLSHFSPVSRAALIYAMDAQGPAYIYDPQDLLRGHEPIFNELYIQREIWKATESVPRGMDQPGFLQREKNLELAGLISFGGRSKSVFYQMWFTEHHPDMCALGPTERWLEYAAWRLSHDMTSEDSFYTGISGLFLREYATHAVRDHIVDEINIQFGWDTKIRVYQILDAVLNISRTREEGVWPSGELVFVDPAIIDTLNFVGRFPEYQCPSIENHKHVRKLLQAVEDSHSVLVSDGKCLVGFCDGPLSRFCITADFRGSFGFLKINGQTICSFADGNFHSTTHRAKLVEVEEALLETRLDSALQTALFKVVSEIVHHAQDVKHGCTVIVDLNDQPVDIQGHMLLPALDLTDPALLALAKTLSKIDCAVHLRADCKLHGFACLMDGKSIQAEDRARGARYNSALRFTADKENLIVVVVSSDKPVSIIQDGMELNARCEWQPISGRFVDPPELADWLAP